MTNITTLRQLADFINSCVYYPVEVNEIIECNGWVAGDDEWQICHNDKEQVIFDDNAIAVVLPYEN